MELLVSILGDCMLSLGYDRSDAEQITPPNHTSLADLGETIRLTLHIDWFDPVIYLVMSYTARFFAPHVEFGMCFWIVYGHADKNERRSAPIRHMLAGKTLNEARREAVLRILERVDQEGTPLTAPGVAGEIRHYQGWVTFTNGICEHLWQRHQLEKEKGGPDLSDIEALLAQAPPIADS